MLGPSNALHKSRGIPGDYRMKLSTLIAAVPTASVVAGDPDVEVASVVIDSRLVGRGAVYCCVPGTASDGHDFAAEALRNGATVLVTERDVDLGAGSQVTEVRVATGTMRSAVAALSAAFHGDPSTHLTMVGVTGTNGKTTVATLLGEIFAEAGFVSSVIGTLTGARTTPSAPELQRSLAEIRTLAQSMGQRGAVAMEVSSHALDQERVGSIVFDVAVFTNLSHDHLDYHETMEAYFEAKATLFEAEHARTCVIWSDTPEGRRLLERRPEAIAVSLTDAGELTYGPGGTTFEWRGVPIRTSLLGEFNVANTLLASEAALACGVDLEVIARAIEGSGTVPGRMQRIVGPAGSPLVIVDYAHTPDALTEALTEARRLVGPDGSLTVVFGCGGERDHDKRPLMGAAASNLADRVIVTTDNPRSEDPDHIAQSIIAGAHGPTALESVPDRRSAILSAIDGRGESDVVVIAGKGHESTQVFATETVTFDDAAVATELLWGEAPC